jgi:hypothetical protein
MIPPMLAEYKIETKAETREDGEQDLYSAVSLWLSLPGPSHQSLPRIPHNSKDRPGRLNKVTHGAIDPCGDLLRIFLDPARGMDRDPLGASNSRPWRPVHFYYTLIHTPRFHSPSPLDYIQISFLLLGMPHRQILGT